MPKDQEHSAEFTLETSDIVFGFSDWNVKNHPPDQVNDLL